MVTSLAPSSSYGLLYGPGAPTNQPARFENGYFIKDYARIWVNDSLGLNPRLAMTLMLWYKGDGISVSKFDGYGGYYILADATTVQAGLKIAQQPKTLFSPIPSQSEWNHLALVYDGNHAELFLNGVSSQRMAALGTLDMSSVPLVITSRFALVDEIRLYDRALSLDELRSIGSLPYTETGATSGRPSQNPTDTPRFLGGEKLVLPMDARDHNQPGLGKTRNVLATQQLALRQGIWVGEEGYEGHFLGRVNGPPPVDRAFECVDGLGCTSVQSASNGEPCVTLVHSYLLPDTQLRPRYYDAAVSYCGVVCFGADIVSFVSGNEVVACGLCTGLVYVGACAPNCAGVATPFGAVGFGFLDLAAGGCGCGFSVAVPVAGVSLQPCGSFCGIWLGLCNPLCQDVGCPNPYQALCEASARCDWSSTTIRVLGNSVGSPDEYSGWASGLAPFESRPGSEDGTLSLVPSVLRSDPDSTLTCVGQSSNGLLGHQEVCV